MRILVTGGAGFIGSNFIRHVLGSDDSVCIVNLDLLTYAGSLKNLESLPGEDRHTFIEGDITDAYLIGRILRDYDIDTIVNFAAESHVDRSIADPSAFIRTNIVGTFTLLESARLAWTRIALGSSDHKLVKKRFLHVSTDEVYGTLAPNDPPFREENRYLPNSPYSASKASSDLLVRAYHETYNLPTVITNCSNNYGPRQHPEKLLPFMILNALSGKPLPVYGDGQQIRDWLYVEDHCKAIYNVLCYGALGETYNIGGLCERTNIDIINALCDLLDGIQPRTDGCSYRNQIVHVADRPGHDRRYAIDCKKIRYTLGWQPVETLDSGLRKTIEWYLHNENWVNSVMSQNYKDWVELNYSHRGEVPA